MTRPGASLALARSAALVVLACAGCVPGDGGAMELAAGDAEVFRAEVEPLLEARCANPSCHGAADRPLEIFAQLKHRADPDEVFRETALTEEELHLNQLRAACFVRDMEHGSTLAKKPLPLDDGGIAHAGGVIFESADDAEYLPLRDWVEATAAALTVQEQEP